MRTNHEHSRQAEAAHSTTAATTQTTGAAQEVSPFLDRVKQLFVKDDAGCLPAVPGYPSGFYSGGGPMNTYTGMGTPRDQNAQGFYGFPRIFSKWELENAYRSSWVAKRIVNLPPNDMTREWRTYFIDDDPEGADVDQIEEAEKDLQVKKRCNTALKWARLYGGSLMFMGIKNQDPAEPLDPTSVGKDDLEWLLVLDRWHVNANQWQLEQKDAFIYDVANPLFGTPQYYYILGSSQQWHASRVIRFDGEELPMDVWQANARWNDSTLNHVLQSVLGLESAQRACLLAMQQGSLDVVSLPGMRQMIGMNANGMEQIYNRVRVFSDLKSVYRVAVKDADEKIDRIAAALGGYDTLFEKYQDEMCGAAEIPHTVLYGQSPAGLSSTGDFDTRQYYDSISTKQENDLRPQLDYLDQVLIRSALGNYPDNYSYDFKSLWQIDEDAQSQIELRKAQRDHIYMTDGALEPEMVTKQLFEDQTYSTLTQDDVDLIESFNEPMDAGTSATAGPSAGGTEEVALPGVLPSKALPQRGKQTIPVSVKTGTAPVAP
jgi:phage-related protein (TIGR01555 family)